MWNEKISIDELLATPATSKGGTNLTDILTKINTLGYEERIEKLEEAIIELFGRFRSYTTSHALAGSGLINMEQPQATVLADIKQAYVIMMVDAMEGADEMHTWLGSHGPRNDWYGRARWLRGILAQVDELEREAIRNLETRERKLIYTPRDIDKFIANPPFAPEPEEPHHFDDDPEVDAEGRVHELEQEIVDLWDAYCRQSWVLREGAEFQQKDRQASEDSTQSINAWLDTRGAMPFEYEDSDAGWSKWQRAREKWLRSIWPIFDAAAQATFPAYSKEVEASILRKTATEILAALPATAEQLFTIVPKKWSGTTDGRKKRVTEALTKLEVDGQIIRDGDIIRLRTAA